jgi:hypothetical protein
MLNELDEFAADLVAYAYSKGKTTGEVIAGLGYAQSMLMLTAVMKDFQKNQGATGEHGMGNGDGAEA